MATWIRPLFYVAAVYDGLLGLAFMVAPLQIFAFHGVEPPNHPGYVQFPALLLVALMFRRIATDPLRYLDLVPYGVGLKAAYCGVVFWHQLGGGSPRCGFPGPGRTWRSCSPSCWPGRC